MRMLRACIYVQFAEHVATKGVLGKHAPNRVLDDRMRLFGQQHTRGGTLLPTGITRVAQILLLIEFTTRKADLVRIDHDHVIAAIYVRCEGRLVLATKHMGDPRAQTSHDLSIGIDDIPLALYFFVFR